MRHDNNFGTGFQTMLDRRHAGSDSCITGDFAILDGDIEVFADEHLFADKVKVSQSLKGHGYSLGRNPLV